MEDRVPMELSPNDCCRLAKALERLALGHWPEFESELWISFGDDWHKLVALLKKHGYIRHKGRYKDEPTITDAGQAFLERLQGRPRAAAG